MITTKHVKCKAAGLGKIGEKERNEDTKFDKEMAHLSSIFPGTAPADVAVECVIVSTASAMLLLIRQ